MGSIVNDLRDLFTSAMGGGSLTADATAAGRGVPYTVIPENYKIETLASYLPRPARKIGTHTFHDLASACYYANVHKTPASIAYFDRLSRQFTVVIDEHAEGEPAWRGFYVQTQLKHSRQWQAWEARAKQCNQKELAEFLEDRISEVVSPDGADLFKLVTTLEATQNASFAASTKLSNGNVKLAFTRDTKAGNGEMELPEKIVVRIPIWENGAPQDFTVKVRFRLAEDKPMFWFEIERKEDVIDFAVDAAVAFVREKTLLPVLFGSPGASTPTR